MKVIPCPQCGGAAHWEGEEGGEDKLVGLVGVVWDENGWKVDALAIGWAHRELWLGGPKPEDVWVVHTKETGMESDTAAVIIALHEEAP